MFIQHREHFSFLVAQQLPFTRGCGASGIQASGVAPPKRLRADSTVSYLSHVDNVAQLADRNEVSLHSARPELRYALPQMRPRRSVGSCADEASEQNV
jgi:hypothetical protein